MAGNGCGLKAIGLITGTGGRVAKLISWFPVRPVVSYGGAAVICCNLYGTRIYVSSSAICACVSAWSLYFISQADGSTAASQYTTQRGFGGGILKPQVCLLSHLYGISIAARSSRILQELVRVCIVGFIDWHGVICGRILRPAWRQTATRAI